MQRARGKWVLPNWTGFFLPPLPKYTLITFTLFIITAYNCLCPVSFLHSYTYCLAEVFVGLYGPTYVDVTHLTLLQFDIANHLMPLRNETKQTI